MVCPAQRCCWKVSVALKARLATPNSKVCFVSNESGHSLTNQQSTRKCEQIPESPVQLSGKLKRVLAATDHAVPEIIGGTKWNDLSISARKKLLKILKLREIRKKRKHASCQSETEDKSGKHLKSGDQLSKYDVKLLQKQKLTEAMCSGLRVAIDCGFESTLSPKEICKLSGQIGRLYGSNKKAEKPFHLYLVALNPLGRLVQECRRQLVGFDSYMVNISQKPAWDLTEKEHLVFLTPDSNNVLKELHSSKTYVLGGLVDESIIKNTTAKFCTDRGLPTARLPIPEYMEQEPGSTAHSVLTVNQVVDVLLRVHCTGDWPAALQENIPSRKKFKPRLPCCSSFGI